MNTYGLPASAFQTVCAESGRLSFPMGAKKGEGGVPGIVMFSRCIALTSGQHNSLTQTTVMYTLCTYILFCGSQQISLLLYSPFSLRFVYVNIYVKCALGFYKCHRARENERGRERTIELSTLCTLCSHTSSDILKASPTPRYNPLGCNQFSPSPPMP